jgi:cyclohexa-1,5-dienecarbonyl-CoA hydratase
MRVGIDYKKNGAFAHLVIKTGDQNWLRAEDFDELSDLIGRAERESKVAFLIIESQVAGVFSFGCDVTNASGHVDAESLMKRFIKVARQLLNTRLITVAKVDGLCAGGGFELVLLCSLSYASMRSVFRFPEILIGCAAPIAAAIYPTVVGHHRALDHMLRAKKISAHEAEAEQIVAEAFETERFEEQFAQRMSELETVVVKNKETAESLARMGRQLARDYLADDVCKDGRPVIPALAKAMSRIASRHRQCATFEGSITSSLYEYAALTRKGVIESGIREYWKKRARDVKKSKQTFRGDWL